MDCLPFGERLIQDFNRERLELKTTSIFATISSKYVFKDPHSQASKTPAVKEPSKDAENNKATRYLEYAISRGKTHDYMLQFHHIQAILSDG